MGWGVQKFNVFLKIRKMEYCGYGDDCGFPIGEPDASTMTGDEKRPNRFKPKSLKLKLHQKGEQNYSTRDSVGSKQ